MESKTEKGSNLNSENLIVFFYKWKKILISVTLVALLCSVVGSLLIKNKYKSTVILFPTTTSSISKALLSANNTGREDILRFGEEEEAEQLLQILNSDEIRKRIVEKYNLVNHYEIDADDEFINTKIQKEYEANVSFERTKFMSVEISVLDYNADTAALIANDISSLLDTVKNRMRKEIAIDAFAIVSNRYNDQKEYVRGLEDSLTSLRKLGVIDYESQAERITEQLSIAILQGKNTAIKALEQKLEVLGKYGGAYVSIREQLGYEKRQLTFIHTKYEEIKVDAETNLQHKFIVNHAFPAEKKAYPIRWLIVVIATFSAFLFTLILLLFVESFKSIMQNNV
jgi:uncharacterized protein involved in exopolysaccharide biosynthesis